MRVDSFIPAQGALNQSWNHNYAKKRAKDNMLKDGRIWGNGRRMPYKPICVQLSFRKLIKLRVAT